MVVVDPLKDVASETVQNRQKNFSNLVESLDHPKTFQSCCCNRYCVLFAVEVAGVVV